MLKRRHLAKALTYRLGGTIITAIIAIIVTQNISTGIIIGPLDFVIKVLLYYIHERIWLLSKFGIRNNKQNV